MIARPAPPRAIPRGFDGPLTMVERIVFFTEIGVSLDVGVQALADLANVSKDLSVKPGAPLFDRCMRFERMGNHLKAARKRQGRVRFGE